MKSVTRHFRDYAFDSQSRDYTIGMDTSGLGTHQHGPSPKELLLSAISGCAGIDVVGHLRKLKVAFDRLEISADAEQTQDHPRVFKSVDLNFCLDGENVSRAAAQEAVELSMTRYCGVSAMVSKVVPLNYRITINGVETHQGSARFFD